MAHLRSIQLGGGRLSISFAMTVIRLLIYASFFPTFSTVIALIFCPTRKIHFGVNNKQIYPMYHFLMFENFHFQEAASSVGRSSFTRVLEEIPVVIHNSHLVNILLTEIVDNQELSRSELSTNSSMLDLAPPLPKDHPGRYSTLNLSMASSLEQQLRSLLAGLETVHDYQYSYQRSLSKSQTTVAGKVNQ